MPSPPQRKKHQLAAVLVCWLKSNCWIGLKNCMIYGRRNCWQGMMLRDFQRIFLGNLLARLAEKLECVNQVRKVGWLVTTKIWFSVTINFLQNFSHQQTQNRLAAKPCKSPTCAAAKDSTPNSKRNQRQLITVMLRIRKCFFFVSGAMATSMLCLCVWRESPESWLAPSSKKIAFFCSQNIWSMYLEKKSKCPVHKLDFCHTK